MIYFFKVQKYSKEINNDGLPALELGLLISKGLISMMACGPEDPGSIPRLAKVHYDVIFFLGVFMIQFNLTKFNW